jgi:hypothetical protein
MNSIAKTFLKKVCWPSTSPKSMSEKIDYETTLTPEIIEIAEKELGEDEHRRTESVLALREWAKKQPHLQAMPLGM